MLGLFGSIKGFFRKKDEVIPIAQLTTEAQDAHFQKMIDAVVYHLVPSLIVKVVQRLQEGQAVVIGPCTVSKQGIGFSTGLIFCKDHLLPWQDVEAQIQSGKIHVLSRTNRKAQVSMPAKDTDNAVILPFLCAEMREDTTSEQEQSQWEVTEKQRNQKSYNKSNLWWLVIPAIFIILWVINSFDSTKTTPSGGSLESKTAYRIPNYIKAELDRDSRLIDSENAKAEQMASQLENLGREIERERSFIGARRQSDIDEFNRKVDTYNGLVEKARAQNRLVNQLVERYNEKLRQYGR